MTDEDKKRIVSEPPPPTDEIDGEWGDDDQTLVREVPESVTKAQPTPPTAAAVAKTAAAPISVPAPASAPVTDEDDEEEANEEDEEDEETTDNEDDEEEADDEHGATAEPAHAVAPASASDWIPEWAPFAVLGLLVTGSILVGLGLIGGGEHAEENEPAAPTGSVVAPAKPSPHP